MEQPIEFNELSKMIEDRLLSYYQPNGSFDFRGCTEWIMVMILRTVEVTVREFDEQK